MALTKKDMAALKKILDRAIIEDLTLGKLYKLPEARELSEEGQEVLHSLTSAELAALKSMVQRLKEHGATTAELKFYAPIH